MTEQEKQLTHLAKLNIEYYLTEKDLNKVCEPLDIITVIEKLSLLKNININKFQSIALTNEILKYNFKRKTLLDKYTKIISLKLWNNELTIDTFIADTDTETLRIAIKAKEILSNWIKSTDIQKNEYEGFEYPHDLIKLYLDTKNKYDLWKQELLKKFSDDLNKAIYINNEILQNYLNPEEIEKYLKVYGTKS